MYILDERFVSKEIYTRSTKQLKPSSIHPTYRNNKTSLSSCQTALSWYCSRLACQLHPTMLGSITASPISLDDSLAFYEVFPFHSKWWKGISTWSLSPIHWNKATTKSNNTRKYRTTSIVNRDPWQNSRFKSSTDLHIRQG